MAYAWAACASLSKADKGLSSTKRVDDEVFLTLKMLIVVRRATVGPQCTDRHKTPLLACFTYLLTYTPAALPESPSVSVPVQRIGDRAFVEFGLEIKIRGQVCKLSK
jgi:hypothetical protein